MTPSFLFEIGNFLALAGWALLVLLPRNRYAILVSASVIPTLLASAYTILIVMFWGQSKGGFSNLQDVMLLFQSPWITLVGWLHYLAFDLLIGTWEVQDAQKQGIPYLAVIPCLGLTFMFGPIGWLLYQSLKLGIKYGLKRQ